jgi:two-component system cell cycle sensor histidine kinase/response regulator CckA
MDPSQLDQILANLCVNARDAIGETGKITMETAAVAFDEAHCAVHPGLVPGNYVMLAVRDDGRGMDRETQARLFEPFFTTKGPGQGTGLGLATVYGIVRQNHGFINVYSEPGQGSTFRIYLPRHLAHSEVPSVPPVAPPPSLQHGTILLVEDEPSLLTLTQRLLEFQGYRVLAAATAGEAIRLAESHAGSIDLLLTDVVMPEMNGRELARNILKLHPGLKRLFMSGYTSNIIAHHGILDEGVHFLQKPFSLADLSARVRKALQG